MLRLITITGTALLLTLPIAGQQQDNSAPPPQQSQSGTKDQQKKPEKKKSADPANPFPQEQSQKAAQQQNQQQDPSMPAAPQPASEKGQAAPPQKKPSTSEANPFPEAQSEKAAHQEEQEQSPAPEGDQEYSSSQVHVKGMETMPSSDADEAPIQASSPLPYDPKLAKKDAQIGDFYLESGDYKGAYERYVEAARSDPGNAEAVWGLAESAHQLQMNDVAIKNYRLYLSALPNGPHAKQIRKALKGMGLEAPGS